VVAAQPASATSASEASRLTRAPVCARRLHVLTAQRRASGGVVEAPEIILAMGGRDALRRETAMHEVTHDAVRGGPTRVIVQIVMRAQRERSG
jgi:hypothetical protein